VEFGYFGGAKQSWEENSKRDLAFLAKPVYRFTFNWPEPPHSGGFLHEYVFDARTGDLLYPLPARGPGETVLAGPVFVFPRPGVQEAILIVPKDIEIKSATMDLETASLDSLPAGETHPLKDLQIVIGRSDNAHASFPKPPAQWTTPDLRDAFYSVMNPQPPSAVPRLNVTRLAFSSASPGRLTVRALRVSFVTGDEAMAQAKRDQFLLVGPRGEVSRPPTPADLEALRDYAKHVVTANPYSTDPLKPLYVAWLYHAVLHTAERCSDPGAARLQADIRDSWWYWIAQEPMTLAKELSCHFPKPADVPADFPKAWADRLATPRPFHSAWIDLTRLAPDGGFLDPWGRPYSVSHASRRGGARFEVRSAGPDGIDADGAGDDVSSWQICAVERRWLLAGVEKEAIDPARVRILYLRADGRSVPTEEPLADRAICAMNLADRKSVELGRGWSPAWSPDGTRIAFASTRDGNAEIYVMDADGRNVKRLTNHPAIDQDPAWSPDGRRIAFTTSRLDRGNVGRHRTFLDVAVMDADGSNVRILTKDSIRCGPRWLSNAEILFYRCDFDGVYVLSAAGGPERPVDLHRGCAFQSLSADRAAMASARYGRDLLVFRAGLPGPIDVTRSLGRNTHPVWIGNSGLVFCSDRADGKQFDLYLMRCDGSEVTRLTETPESEFPYDAFVAPEGTK
jgi:TolB protein